MVAKVLDRSVVRGVLSHFSPSESISKHVCLTPDLHHMTLSYCNIIVLYVPIYQLVAVGLSGTSLAPDVQKNSVGLVNLWRCVCVFVCLWHK